MALAHGDAREGVDRVELRLERRFEDLVALRASAGEVAAAVDIPIGLLETGGPRPCDEQARKLLGARASTVFAPPSRPLLAATTYADARKLATPGAKGLSAQAFGIAAKIREVDDYLRGHPGAQAWLWECHPELCFRALAGGEALRDKKSVGGQGERLRLLSRRFPRVLDALAAFPERSRDADMTDALDALVGLHTALKVRTGDFEHLGGETDAAGLVMRIVF